MRYKESKGLARCAKAIPLIIGLIVFAVAGFHTVEVYEAGRVSSQKSRLLNEGQQIESAFRLLASQSDGAPLAALTLLQSQGHLEKIPPKWTDGDGKSYFLRAGLTPEECRALNEEVPPTGKSMVVFVQDPTTERTAKYGCLSGSNQLFYKVVILGPTSAVAAPAPSPLPPSAARLQEGRNAPNTVRDLNSAY